MLTLIIDDNATNRRILSELTRQWKMKPHMCDSGESGLAELLRAASEGNPYRLLLLDEQMPGMDGMEVLDRIRRNPVLQSVVIMMLTSCDQVKSAARCRQMGVETYLIKPISASDLLGSIRLAIGAHTPASTVTLPAAGISAFVAIAKDPAGRRQPGESKSRHDVCWARWDIGSHWQRMAWKQWSNGDRVISI